jgi:hypothetical protein
MIKSIHVRHRGSSTIFTVEICIALCMVMASAATGAGCRRPTQVATARSDSPVVATVEGIPIRADDVAIQMRRHRTDRGKALDDLVVFELLARASASAGTVVPVEAADGEGLRNAMIERLVERDIEPRIARNAIPDAEVRTLYEKGKAHFVHGRLVEVAILCVFTGARMKPEPRSRAETTAGELKAVVDRRAKTVAELEAIANDPVWTNRKVSFSTVLQGEDAPFPRVVGRAVLALSAPGDTTPLVGDETGYYIARYVSEKPPQNISFAEAAPGLRAEMYEPWRRQRFLQLSMEMAAGHDIQVFPDNIALTPRSRESSPR